ncbi:MAG: 50S ribosomal protein L24 [Clostridiales Family XIII bacterium]|jgi:large subunit ribosomal protein L24|nr:50S ribosomal protein L24 [Clostridiales Family XIII bacterium]
MKIKKDDTVMVITGKDKGKHGKVLKVYPKQCRLIVEGVNIQTKHQKQTRKARAEIKHQEGPIHVSNVMYYETLHDRREKIGTRQDDGGQQGAQHDRKEKAPKRVPTRIGYTFVNGRKVRVSKKTRNTID